MAINETSKTLGLRAIPVPVVGTGSMYPSLFWAKSEGGPEDENQQLISELRTTPHLFRRFLGFTIFGQTYFKPSLHFGDMVAFRNTATEKILQNEHKNTSAGFIKRIIGVPGDKLELRDGFVYLNSSLLDEPYLSAPRSTYGGSSLKECSPLTIPPHQYFVMGDNRKVSSDSRFELGLVSESDITYFLPLSAQSLYRPLWRDTSKDQELMGQPTIDTHAFLTLLNQERVKHNLVPYALVPSLIQSSSLRGAKLLQDPKTAYSLAQALKSAGYSNIIFGEFISHGQYSAAELLENLLYHPLTAQQILNKDYTDLGLAAVNLEVAGCPHQIIVGHLGGYLPAQYDASTRLSWQNLGDNLRSVIPSWEQAVGRPDTNQDKLGELLVILHRRLALASEVIGVMERREWLTSNQEENIRRDDQDAQTAQQLAQELNQE